MRPKPPRAGFAMMLVLVFIVLFLAMLGVTLRATGSALRIESARLRQLQRDEGSIHALAKGVALLETGLPPSDPYVCGVDIDTTSGTQSYTVTFESEGGDNWSVHSALSPAGYSPSPMPVTFAP